MPDLSSKSVHSDKTEVKQELTTLKGKMELDLNVQVSDVLKVESAKVEAEAYVYDVGSHSEEGGDMVEQKSFFENTGPIPDLETSKSISGNSKLMKLVKLTRHLWMKNWEFLQDCAIRFLCVMSLDRVDQNGRFAMGAFWVSSIWSQYDEYDLILHIFIAHVLSKDGMFVVTV
ncbi:hypothetical protein IFM89_019534 [Coptis chinensis]|uniref:Uncharacterized protein n=1 Tax=Coptis chinensis TaxID=261450 RepID=A0A835I4R8_9MAGN|nr:hypothetical protein IFM89_019534 [Coptis chinensis]